MFSRFRLCVFDDSYGIVRAGCSQRQSDAAAITAGHGVFVTDNGMYETRFGLNRKPFQTVLSNADFFESAAYAELAESVLHALRSDLGVAVLTGPSGIGKTVTLDRFRRELDKDGQAMVLRGGNLQSPDDLLQSLHRRLIPPPGKNASNELQTGHVQRWEVLDRMQRVADFWGPTIILLDDAHLANQEIFAELRTLLEEESEGHKLVRLLIAGPLTFEEFLAAPSMADFVQRIRAHVFLQPLTSSESVEFLNHQIQRVGGDTSTIFESNAIERIVTAADGVPRCIDMLADESMMAAERADLSIVDRTCVDNALSRLQHLPHSWNVSLIDADDMTGDDDEEFLTEEGHSESLAPVITAQAAAEAAEPNAIEIGGPEPAARERIVVDTSSGAGVIEIGAPVEAAVPSTPGPVQQAFCEPRNAENSEPKIETSIEGSIEIGGADEAAPTGQQSPTAPLAEITSIEVGSHVNGLIDDAQNSIDSREDISNDIGTEVSAEEFLADDNNKGNEPSAPASSPPAKPIDFDKVFGAVTIAGGAIAVSKNVISEGTRQPAESTTPEESVTSNAVNLERHMILAANSEDDTKTHPSEMETTQLIAETPEEEEEEEEEEADADAESPQVTLSTYAPWQPAGEWYSASKSPRSYFHSPGHANSKPVFDRYTWCELGRAVGPTPAKRSTNIVMGSEEVTWPPVTDSVAPANDIPVLPIDNDYAGILADLGSLMSSTSSTLSASQDIETSSVTESSNEAATQSREASLQIHSPVAGYVDPEESINNIEQLLNSESSPSEPVEVLEANWFGSREEIQASSSGVDAADESADPTAANTETTKPDTESAHTSTDAEDEDSDSSDNNNPPGSSQQLFTLPIDIQDVEFDPSASFQSERADDGGPEMNIEQNDQDVQQSQIESPLADEVLSETALEEIADVTVEETVQQQQQAYAPRLLKNARSRVTSVSTNVGGLKRAAGAESLADDSEVDTRSLYPEIHSPDLDNEDDDAPARSFSNLFTRLRQLRGR